MKLKVVASLFAFATWAMAESLALPAIRSNVLLEGMPSFGQRNVEFTGGGKNFCGPTAASNALMWLSGRGYPSLKPSAAEDPAAQKEMIKLLASLMGTSREGTSVSSFTCGVNTYVRNSGYSPKAWVLSGRGCPTGGLTPPDVNVVQTLSSGSTVMWLSLGWYQLDASSQKYTRDYGHWVTLVGYGTNREGVADPNAFVIADPEAPNGYRYVTLRSLGEGRISNGKAKTDTKGYYNLVELNSQAANRPVKYCVLESIQGLTIE